MSIPEEDIVYEVPSDDQLMTELVDIFKIAGSSNGSEDVDYSTEIAAISHYKAWKLYKHFYYKKMQVKHIKVTNILERYIREKKTNTMRQTSIDQYVLTNK